MPAFPFGFGDAGDQVVVDLGNAGPLGALGPVHAAAQLCSCMHGFRTRGRRCRWRPCGVRSAEEFGPFFVGGGAVFLAGPQQGAALGQECQVGMDRLVGVDGPISHGHVQVLVAGDDLGDVRGQAAHDGVGDEDPPEVVGSSAAGSCRCGRSDRCWLGWGEHVPDRAVADPAAVGAEPALEQQREPGRSAGIRAGRMPDERHRFGVAADAADDDRQDVGQLWADDQESLGISL